MSDEQEDRKQETRSDIPTEGCYGNWYLSDDFDWF